MDWNEFSHKLAATERPVVVYFWAPWCLPCRFVSPAIEKLKQNFSDQVEVWKLNADDHPGLLQALNIYGIPTLIQFQAGREVTRLVGAASYQALESWLAVGAGGAPAQNPTKRGGISTLDRGLRLLSGLSIALLGWLNGPAWFLLIIGGLIAFWGIYDRCPIWKMVSKRLSDTVKRMRAA